MRSKIRVAEVIRYLDLEGDLQGLSLEDASQYFYVMHKMYEKSMIDKDSRFVIDFRPYGYDGGGDFVLQEHRWETDEECDARMKALQASQEKAKKAAETRKQKALAKALKSEQDELDLYEKLRAKFGEQTPREKGIL